MIDKQVYVKLRHCFANYLLAVGELQGGDAAAKSVSMIAKTLRNIDAFYDPDAAAGQILKRSLNGKSQMLTAEMVAELTQAIRLFVEKVDKAERKNLVRNLELSIETEQMRTVTDE